MPALRTKIYSLKLTKDEALKLAAILESGNYVKTAVPYTTISVKTDNCTINLYQSGKVLVQGEGTEEFVQFVLEPSVTGKAVLGNEAIIDPKSVAPHAGVDESGKGDYFGPLVACAVYTDPNISERMREIGARDCKVLSDKQVLAIGPKLRAYLGPNRFKIVPIGPEAYNRLHEKLQNVNKVLAWAHARAIENILLAVPSCPRAVADQFGQEYLIKSALMKNGREIVLEQHHKAESDIAVAAASVIAREYFLLSLKKISETYGIEIPKGASQTVIAQAKLFVKKHGVENLPKIAKISFKTTEKVLKEEKQ